MLNVNRQAILSVFFLWLIWYFSNWGVDSFFQCEVSSTIHHEGVPGICTHHTSHVSDITERSEAVSVTIRSPSRPVSPEFWRQIVRALVTRSQPQQKWWAEAGAWAASHRLWAPKAAYPLLSSMIYISWNKTRYFRLRRFDEVVSESNEVNDKAERQLGRSESEWLRLSEEFENITERHTDRLTCWATVWAKKETL